MSLSTSLVLTDYLCALQELHLRHQSQYELQEANPNIHVGVDYLDRELSRLHQVSLPLQIKTFSTPLESQEALRARIHALCSHKSVRRHLPPAPTSTPDVLTHLFHKYRLNQEWLVHLRLETKQHWRQTERYLHELLLTLDLAYQLRSLAAIYAK